MNMQKKSGAVETSTLCAIVAAVCIVIYLAALIQGAIRLYLSAERHKLTAEQEFEHIGSLAISAGTVGFMDERFVETMNNALVSSKSIEALIISGPEGEYAFERQKGRAVTWVNNSPRFTGRFNYSSQNHYNPLPIQNLRNANIKAVSTSFSYTEFSRILKETLILILIGFAIAFFTMLLQSLLGKTAEKEKLEEAPVYTAKKSEPTVPIVNPVSSPVVIKTERVKTENYTENYEEEKPQPKGLYSPRTNIGWEEYTKDRLDSELHRCASTEKDLTLIAMEFTDKLNDAQFKLAAEEVAAFFTSRDLLFESGKRGIIVIDPGYDLETGLSRAQKLHQRMMEKIFHNHSGRFLYIGMTSRSGRLLNAGRLLMEASEALRRAKKERESPIIAFKSDPDKYRNFIHKQA